MSCERMIATPDIPLIGISVSKKVIGIRFDLNNYFVGVMFHQLMGVFSWLWNAVVV